MRDVQCLDNPFYSPFSGSVLIKGVEEGGKWQVYLEASNEGLDQDDEKVLQKALKEAAPYYLSHGVLSWDHRQKHTGRPEFIIGEPEDVAFPEDGRTLVKGFLYKENDIAQQVWKNIQSQARLGASIGGGIIQKSNDGVNTIQRLRWDETAITHKPVNDITLGNVTTVPFNEFAKALCTPTEVLDLIPAGDNFWKALMAGGGVNASNYSGGRALTGESMDTNLTDLTFGQRDIPGVTYEEGRRYFDGLLSGIHKGLIKSFNDVVTYTIDQGYHDSVTATLIDFVARKIPNIRR